LYQTNSLKDRLKLPNPVGKDVFTRIKNKDQIVSSFQFVFKLTIGFPTDSLLPVSRHRILETTYRADSDSVAIQIVAGVVDPYSS
jgi:hypothetical protein